MPIYIWYPTILSLAMGYSFMSIPPAADQFMALFEAGHGGLSVFLSGMGWTHGLLQIPAGLLVDRMGVRRMLAMASLAGLAANLAPFVSPASLALATVSRLLLGCCTALLFLIGLRLVAYLAPKEKMATAQGVYGGTFGLGTMLPYMILPCLGGRAWLFSYLVGALLFLAVFCGMFALPRPGLGAACPGDAGMRDVTSVLRRAVACREIWMLGTLHAFSFATLNNLGQWLPSMLADLTDSTMAAWHLATTLVLLAGSLSRGLSGAILQYVSRGGTIIGAIAVVAVLYTCLGLSRWGWATLAAGLLLALLCGLNYGSVYTMGGQVLPPANMATALALLNMIANIGTVALTLLLGNVREYTGKFQPAMLLVGVLAFVAWLAFRNPVRALNDRLLAGAEDPGKK